MGNLYLSFICITINLTTKTLTREDDSTLVRLHATKDYLDMLLLKSKYPNVKATFNMVPSLVRQLEEYCEGKTDTYLDLTMKPAESLTDGKNCSYLETFLNLIFGGKYPISRDTWNFIPSAIHRISMKTCTFGLPKNFVTYSFYLI